MYHLHSGLRYLVLLAGVAVIGYAIYALVTGRPYDRTIRNLSATFMLTVDVTAFVGLTLTVSRRVMVPGMGGHVASAVFAVVVLHVVSAVQRRRPPEERSHAPHLVSAVVALALVWVAIASIGRPLIG